MDNDIYEKIKDQEVVPQEQHWVLRPVAGVWYALVALTAGLTVAKILGASIPLWMIFLPLGLPIGLLIALPIYGLLAIMAVIVLAVVLLIVAIPPMVFLCLVYNMVDSNEE